ncbi:MAG: alkene reductase [Candidatus Omnitrophota bacterium]|jgi:N-ethylmaleimide reductase
MASPKLFEPFSIGSLRFKNRIALAPMTRARAGASRVPNDLMAEYYHQRSGAGLLITEAAVISEQGIGWSDSPGIYTPAMVEGWEKVTSRARCDGTPIFLQLWHCGRASHSAFHGGRSAVSASAVKIDNGEQIHTPLGKKPYEVPHPLSVEEIKAVVRDYREAAANAKAAGFSGVEVHGANGYLINQFLDPKSNKRTDAYGGSVENRFRFYKEVLEAVLEIWPREQVGARLSPNGVFNDMGSPDFRETYLYAAGAINRLGIGYLHVMDGLAFGFHKQGEPMTLPEFRKVYTGAIIANCGYTLASAEAVLAAGSADMIAFGRPFITNPDLPERFKNGWPLSPYDDMSKWYGTGAEGYTDFLPYQAALSSRQA